MKPHAEQRMLTIDPFFSVSDPGKKNFLFIYGYCNQELRFLGLVKSIYYSTRSNYTTIATNLAI